MKAGKRAAALCLAAALLLPAGAAAAEPDTAGRREDLEFLCTTLREVHPNLFANVTETQFEAKKSEIETRLETSSDWDFSMDMQSLAALVGDSHTTLSLSSSDLVPQILPFTLEYYGKWVLAKAEEEHKGYLGQTVTAMNGIPMDQVCERFAAITSADNEVKLRRQTKQTLYVTQILTYLGIPKPDGPVVLTVEDGAGKQAQLTMSPLSAEAAETLKLISLKSLRASLPATEYDKTKYYFAKPLDTATYYIQYNRCAQDKEFPMEELCAQVRTDLDSGSYSQVIVDLRNNGGGSDGILQPLLHLLSGEMEERGTKVIGLIGETTFSSAVINAAMLKEMGCLLVGEPTSGSVDHFGSVNSFQLPNSGLKVGCSTKMIRLSALLESMSGYGIESLKPDYTVVQTPEDYRAGIDSAVDYVLKNGASLTVPEDREAVLTRGRFVWMLWQAAGSPQPTGTELAFPEVLGYSYYVPALLWAVEQGIVMGNGASSFDAARPVTREEAALFLSRFVSALGKTPAAVPEAPQVPEGVSPWAAEGVFKAAGWGLWPAAARPGDTLTRAEGAALLTSVG